jgi:hypothetical protein
MSDKAFYALITKDSNNAKPEFKKLTYDKIVYYDVPKSHQNIDLHPLITGNGQYNTFLRQFDTKKIQTKDNYLRHIKFSIYNKNYERTSEAKFYIDSTGQFVIDKKVISKEQTHNESVQSINLDTVSTMLTMYRKFEIINFIYFFFIN